MRVSALVIRQFIELSMEECLTQKQNANLMEIEVRYGNLDIEGKKDITAQLRPVLISKVLMK